MTRGFVAIGLHQPKAAVNVGSVLRAAGCFDADLVVVSGRRIKGLTHTATDTQKAWRHIPLLCVDDLFAAHPLGATPVAVDLVPGAVSLAHFWHPERAYYLFGPEDGTLGANLYERCPHRVMIPTAHCLNLAATVNVVLYDRMAKSNAAQAKGLAA